MRNGDRNESECFKGSHRSPSFSLTRELEMNVIAGFRDSLRIKRQNELPAARAAPRRDPAGASTSTDIQYR